MIEMTETLSDRRRVTRDLYDGKDVKWFIRRVKEEVKKSSGRKKEKDIVGSQELEDLGINTKMKSFTITFPTPEKINQIIDKLAGKDLIDVNVLEDEE